MLLWHVQGLQAMERRALGERLRGGVRSAPDRQGRGRPPIASMRHYIRYLSTRTEISCMWGSSREGAIGRQVFFGHGRLIGSADVAGMGYRGCVGGGWAHLCREAPDVLCWMVPQAAGGLEGPGALRGDEFVGVLQEAGRASKHTLERGRIARELLCKRTEVLEHPRQEGDELLLDVPAYSGQDSEECWQGVVGIRLCMRQQDVYDRLPVEHHQLEGLNVVVEGMRGFQPLGGTVRLAPGSHLFLSERGVAAPRGILNRAFQSIPVYINLYVILSLLTPASASPSRLSASWHVSAR